jgi:hypothetical protein
MEERSMALKQQAMMLVLAVMFTPPALCQSTMKYQQLPAEIRSYIDEIHDRCQETDPEFRLFDTMEGISVITLEGRGSRDLMVDAQRLCNDQWIKDGNCTNRGCDLKIWKQTGAKSWKKVFDEHLHRKFISVIDDRFRLMAASVYAGDAHCNPDPKKFYTSGQSCDVMIYYRNGNWVWEKIK